ncbi:hypothetical protein BO99DRAFT_436385 [Aspergillus violaceofuscus CBS 115571]|uniref:Uncharacterized protein n=1 Tax=Aspergillus violaceofuscus (strain CBS 115571) TaxID=1450538 RepID=A0A2V5H1E7_ASPV1|nr:hypothetical protein BO99DRAFT_436385 [Aspergillus violaceofuscus CBS 115571]
MNGGDKYWLGRHFSGYGPGLVVQRLVVAAPTRAVARELWRAPAKVGRDVPAHTRQRLDALQELRVQSYHSIEQGRKGPQTVQQPRLRQGVHRRVFRRGRMHFKVGGPERRVLIGWNEDAGVDRIIMPTWTLNFNTARVTRLGFPSH